MRLRVVFDDVVLDRVSPVRRVVELETRRRRVQHRVTTPVTGLLLLTRLNSGPQSVNREKSRRLLRPSEERARVVQTARQAVLKHKQYKRIIAQMPFYG